MRGEWWIQGQSNPGRGNTQQKPQAEGLLGVSADHSRGLCVWDWGGERRQAWCGLEGWVPRALRGHWKSVALCNGEPLWDFELMSDEDTAAVLRTEGSGQAWKEGDLLSLYEVICERWCGVGQSGRSGRQSDSHFQIPKRWPQQQQQKNSSLVETSKFHLNSGCPSLILVILYSLPADAASQSYLCHHQYSLLSLDMFLLLL